ncbi:MAG: DUF1573 domain-containing protein [Desulfuromonadales bacterium]|nr:DUF1573 domain-containing protein [Desulfuromonadales bacterium]
MRGLFIVLVLLLIAAPAWAAPRVKVESSSYDFGEVVQGDKVEYLFRFRNVGDDVLVIDSVHSSCGCTAALLSAKRIAPGDTGEIRTNFDSSNFRDAVTKTITMTTNDPENSTVRFQLQGQVIQELSLTPARIGFGTLAPGAKVEETVIIKNTSGETVTLDPPRTTNPNLQASLEKTSLEPGQQVALSITAQVPLDAKRLSGYVMVDTSYAKVSTLRLSVSASVSQ